MNVVCGFDMDLLVPDALHRDMIEVHLAVHHKQRIWLRKHVLANTYTVEE